MSGVLPSASLVVGVRGIDQIEPDLKVEHVQGGDAGEQVRYLRDVLEHVAVIVV